MTMYHGAPEMVQVLTAPQQQTFLVLLLAKSKASHPMIKQRPYRVASLLSLVRLGMCSIGMSEVLERSRNERDGNAQIVFQASPDRNISLIFVAQGSTEIQIENLSSKGPAKATMMHAR